MSKKEICILMVCILFMIIVVFLGVVFTRNKTIPVATKSDINENESSVQNSINTTTEKLYILENVAEENIVTENKVVATQSNVKQTQDKKTEKVLDTKVNVKEETKTNNTSKKESTKTQTQTQNKTEVPSSTQKTPSTVTEKMENTTSQKHESTQQTKDKETKYVRNDEMINKIKQVIINNESEYMKEYGYNIVIDSSITEDTNQFTFTEKRVKDKIEYKFSTIRIYAQDYYTNGELLYTECFII